MRLICDSCGKTIEGELRAGRYEPVSCAACRIDAAASSSVPPPVIEVEPSAHHEIPIYLDPLPSDAASETPMPADLDWGEAPPPSARKRRSSGDISRADLDALAAICPPNTPTPPPASRHPPPPRRQDGRIDFEAVFQTKAHHSALPLTPRAPEVDVADELEEVDPESSRPPAALPRLAARPPPPPRKSTSDAASESSDEDDEDRGPSSGLRDLQRLTMDPPPPPPRIDRELYGLTGSLFDATTAPAGPPTLSPLPPPTPLGRAPRITVRPPPPLRERRGASHASIDPVAVSRPPTEAGGRSSPVVSPANDPSGVRRSWVVGGLLVAAAALVVVGKLGGLSRDDGRGRSKTSATTAPSVASVAPSAVESTERAAPPPTATESATTNPSAAASVAPPPAGASGLPSAATPPPATTAAPGPMPTAANDPYASNDKPGKPNPAEAVPATPPPAAAGADFDPDAARQALAGGAAAAHACRGADDPSGMARITVTFAPSGRVTTARIAGPPFQGTPTGSCIAQRFQTLRVPPFEGAPVTVTKEVTIQ